MIEGAASIDESAITGESAPVVREAGSDRSGVTGGTRVLSDRITVEITAGAGESFMDRMISLVEGAVRQKTPNELALTVTLAGLTLGFLLVTATLYPMAKYFDVTIPLPTLISLLVCLIPTTIGALLAAIGIAGMDRALASNVLAKSGKAVELAGDIDTLLLDKTGTITVGDRLASEFYPVNGVSRDELIEIAVRASFGDRTPEGRSIITLAGKKRRGGIPKDDGTYTLVEFTAQTRMSGNDAADGTHYRKGASDAVIRAAREAKVKVPHDIEDIVTVVAEKGCTPIVVAENNRICGVVALSDILKTGIRDRFKRLRHGTARRNGDGGQPAHGGGNCPGSRRGRFHRGSKAGRQTGLYPPGAGERAPGRDDGRRNQRRARIGAGGYRYRHELRNAGGERSRQYGRPRQRPDQTD